MFNLPPNKIDQSILDVIPKCVNQEDNLQIAKCPQEAEIKEVILDMSPDNAAGPDGYSGKFYQFFSDIVKENVVRFVQFFFKKEL